MQINSLTIGWKQVDHGIYKQAAAKLADGEWVTSTIARLVTQGITDAKIDGDVIVVDGIVIAWVIQWSTMQMLQGKYKWVFANTITWGISFD